MIHNDRPLVVEISFGFRSEAYKACPGYWDDNLKWHGGFFTPEDWMVEDLVANEN